MQTLVVCLVFQNFSSEKNLTKQSRIYFTQSSSGTSASYPSAPPSSIPFFDSSSLHSLSALFLVPDHVDQLFHYLIGNILFFRCFVSSMTASLKSLSMPANDTGILKMIFAHTFSLASLLNFQKPAGSLIGARLSRNSLISNRCVLRLCAFSPPAVRVHPLHLAVWTCLQTT